MTQTLTERFIKGLHEYDLTEEEVRGWKYYGGSSKCHLNYYKLASKNDVLPEHHTHCACGHPIKENCYITDGERILVLGNCCIKRFLPKKNSGRTCEVCGEPHKNRKINKCNECRIGVCDDCNKECDPRYKKCAKCFFG
jgi:hypothetical protein